MKRVLTVAVATSALAVAACGSKSDSDKIKDLVNKINDDPTALCDNATPRFLAQVGGKAGCTALAKAEGNKGGRGKVSDINVNGDTATATVTDTTPPPSKVSFKKIDGDWKVDSSSP